MPTTEKDVTKVEEQIRGLAARLRTHRHHPCLPFVSRSILHADFLVVRDALWFLRWARKNQTYGQRQYLAGGLQTSLMHAFQSWFLRVSAKTRYAERLLKRYRPAFWAEWGPKLLDQLVHAYPTHGFVIDQEEAQDLGLPMRTPDLEEAIVLDQLALKLIEFGTEHDLIALVGLSPRAIAAAHEVLDRQPETRQAGGRPPKRRQLAHR